LQVWRLRRPNRHCIEYGGACTSEKFADEPFQDWTRLVSDDASASPQACSGCADWKPCEANQHCCRCASRHRRLDKANAALQAEAHDTQSTRLGPITALGLRCLRRGSAGPIVIPGDDHRPIGTPRLRAFCTRDANPRCSLHQEILSMSARMDPLIQSFGKAVMPISDIFGSSSGTRRCHARTERASDIMVKHVPCRHCLGLLLSNSVER
jgi:hypothetical protein